MPPKVYTITSPRIKYIGYSDIYYVLYIISLILLIYIVYTIVYQTDIVQHRRRMYTHSLEHDGVCVIPRVFNETETHKLKHLCEQGNYRDVGNYIHGHYRLLNALRKCTPPKVSPDYRLQDYIWVIQKSSVHTCHRDNNGDFFNNGQRHPSYTVLVYLDDMEKCLGVIPRSHHSIMTHAVNMQNNVVNLVCNKGDIIVFNANLIHVGSINKRENNLRIQLKWSDKNDAETLSYYENFHKVLNNEPKMPVNIRKMQRNMSCMFPFVSDMTQRENIRTSRGTSDGVNMGWGLKMFSTLFYGNSNYYDLPNAW